MTQSRTVLILGGGAGGVVAAHRLRHLLPKQDRIILVDRQRDHLFAPSLLWLMIGQRRPENITRPIDRIHKKGIEVVRGEIEKIDPATRTISVNGITLVGDAMIISLGAEYNENAIPGLAQAGHNLYTLAGATEIRDMWATFTGGSIVILTAAPAYKCPPAPYEASLLIDYHLRKLGLRDRSEISIYAAEPGPMMTAGPDVSAAVRQMVEARGVKYHPTHQVTHVDREKKQIVFANGAQATFDHLIYVAPHQVPKVVQAAGLSGESGWISIDRQSCATQFDGVYAIGDVTSVPLKLGKPLPKAGVFAHAQAQVVAQNIASQWQGRTPRASFTGEGVCFIETGYHRAGIGTGNFYAEPLPQIKIKKPTLWWHLAKVLFEKYWFWRWF